MSQKHKYLYARNMNQSSEELPGSVLSVSAFIDNLNLQFSGIQARIRWEVSQWKTSPSWHAYFILKDISGGGVIECMIFKWSLISSDVDIEMGMEIIITASPNYYAKTGRLTVIAKSVELAGEWAMRKAYDRLKRKLEKEGIFDQNNKIPIPKYVQKIGLISSKGGVVIQDFMQNIWNRWFKVYLFDSRVEWPSALSELLTAIQSAQWLDLDVIALIRWGGSFESMKAFNDESLIRAVFSSSVPVICGVWHDVDLPLACMAASESCSTPSMVARRLDEPYAHLEKTMEQMFGSILSKYIVLQNDSINAFKSGSAILLTKIHSVISENQKWTVICRQFISAAMAKTRAYTNTLNHLSNSMIFHQNRSIIHASKLVDNIINIPMRQRAKIFEQLNYDLSRSYSILRSWSSKISTDITLSKGSFEWAYARCLERMRTRIVSYEAFLRLHDPQRLLSLGYGITTLNWKVVRNISQLSRGDLIESRISNGTFASKIMDFHQNNQEDALPWKETGLPLT